MKIKLSEKNQKIAPSATMAIDAKAKAMMAAGLNVISFGVGEPDFATPENIRAAAVEAMEKGMTRYTAASGFPKLKEAITVKLKQDNKLEYKPEQIVVSNGAKQALHNALMAVCNPGDQVIIPVPYWVSYEELVKLVDGVPVFVPCHESNAFKLTEADLRAAITPQTKALILNTPANPTGALYDRQELEMIARLAVEYGFIVISDEIYEKLVYDGAEHISIASLNETIYDQTIVINGMSKAYAMTGWRIGYTASNGEIAKLIGNIQSHTTSHPNTIAQYASIEALLGDNTSVEIMRQAFDERRKYMVQRINEIAGLSCIVPKGAFYVMMNISQYLGKTIKGQPVANSGDFARIILEEAQVALVPGSAFGADEFVRISYANSLENIQEGLNRIEAALK